MAVYYISPSEETDLRIDPTQLVEALREQWPDVTVEEVDDPDSNRLLEWTIQMKHGEVEGSLDRTMQVVRLDGDLGDCAEFAIWLRSKVDRKYRLIIYDEGFEADVDLSMSHTPEQIVENFG